MSDKMSPTEIQDVKFEPKLNNRFVVYMESIPSYVIHRVFRPALSLDNGKYKYDNLVMELWDPINFDQQGIKSTATILTELQRNNKMTFDKIRLAILGPIGDEVESWLFKNCEIKRIDYSTLDWSISQPITITITLSFKEIIHEF